MFCRFILYYFRPSSPRQSIRKLKTEWMLFGRPPPVRGTALLGRHSMQAAGFIVNYAQRCLLCLHQHARSRGRPPAPPHRRRTLCKNVQNFVSLRVIGTHGPRLRGVAGKLVSAEEMEAGCRAVKMEMRCAMVRRSHHGPWTLELRTKVIRRFTKIPQSRRRVGYHSVLSHLSLYNCVGIPISLTTTYHGVNVCLA